MEDEAQRIIREARARVMDRLRDEEETSEAAASPCYGGGGAIRRSPPVTPPPRWSEPPVQELLSLCPDTDPDPGRAQDLSRVLQLSLNPVPQSRSSPQRPQYDWQQQNTWDYEYEDSGQGECYNYQDPSLWGAVQSFDPYAPEGAVGPDPEYPTSYYDMLSEIQEPEVDLSGGLEDILGRARHRAMLGAGYRRDVPLYPTPYCPGSAAAVESEEYFTEPGGPSLDDILAGAPPLESDCDMDGMDLYEIDDEDLDLLPQEAFEDMGDDFAVQATQGITTDAFGLPIIRCTTHADRAQREQSVRAVAERARRRLDAARRACAQGESVGTRVARPRSTSGRAPPATAAEAGMRMQQPSTTAACPPTSVARPTTCPAQPPSGAVQQPTRRTRPPSGSAQPPTDVACPRTGTARQPTGSARPPTDAACPRTGTARQPTGSARPPTDAACPRTGTARQPTGSARPPSDAACPRTGTARQPTGPVRPPTGAACPPTRTARQPTGTARRPTDAACPRTGAARQPSSRAPPSASAACPSTSTAVPSTSSARPSTSTARPPSGRAPSGARGGACPAPARKTPADKAAEEKAAKAAAALAMTKKRTQYQPPRLRSRPPTKPPTKPKAPRCLEQRDRDKDRDGVDPTRDMMYYRDDYQIEPEPMFEALEPRFCDVGERVVMDVDHPGLLEEITGIIGQTRNSLIEAISRYG